MFAAQTFPLLWFFSRLLDFGVGGGSFKCLGRLVFVLVPWGILFYPLVLFCLFCALGLPCFSLGFFILFVCSVFAAPCTSCYWSMPNNIFYFIKN
jgi:hypothetical protein